MFRFGLLFAISWAVFLLVTTANSSSVRNSRAVDNSWETVASDIKRCTFSDEKCLTASITDILRKHHSKGHRGLNLIPFDPLHIKNLVLPRIPNSPVNIELKFSEIDLTGFSKGIVTKVVGFNKEAADLVFELSGTLPQIVVTGPYSVEGQVILLPITGQGNSKIVFEDTTASAKFKCEIVEKDGKKYLNIIKAQLNLEPKKMTINFDNLFGGDKVLGDNMNTFLNENWKDVYNELKPVVGEAIGKIIVHMANGVFSKFPYDELFLSS